MSKNRMEVLPLSESPLAESTDEMRNRVTKLGDDGMVTLAEAEDKFRTKHLFGMDPEQRSRAADADSDKDLKNMELEKRLSDVERASGTDALTGLSNRATMDRELPKFVSREIAEGIDGSLLMVDLDHFKKVNDELGHPAGDEVLRQLAKILRDTVRPSDRVYRYGGEEFLVYLPGDSLRNAESVASRIREAIEEAVMDVVDGSGMKRSLKKTASIGCVGMDTAEVIGAHEDLFAMKGKGGPISLEDAEKIVKTLIAYADKALYTSKEAGRNRVTVYRSGLQGREAGKDTVL